MVIRLAKPKDLKQINELLSTTDLPEVSVATINHRDIVVVAEDKGKIVGFIFVGLMKKNTLGYVDSYCVHKDYRRKGVGEALANKAFQAATKRGVKDYIGFIRLDESHDASAINALKKAMKTDSLPYHYFFGNVKQTLKELGELNGR